MGTREADKLFQRRVAAGVESMYIADFKWFIQNVAEREESMYNLSVVG